MRIKRKIAGVIGSSSENHEALSIPLGQWLARKGYNLINGGGNGVMFTTAKAFVRTMGRTGLVLGVLPSKYICDTVQNRSIYQSPLDYPNEYIDISIRTHLHLSGVEGKETSSRNHIIILTSDFVIALPGGLGTRSEIQLALEYTKPLIIISPNNEWNEYINSPARFVKNIDEAFKVILSLR